MGFVLQMAKLKWLWKKSSLKHLQIILSHRLRDKISIPFRIRERGMNPIMSILVNHWECTHYCRNSSVNFLCVRKINSCQFGNSWQMIWTGVSITQGNLHWIATVMSITVCIWAMIQYNMIMKFINDRMLRGLVNTKHFKLDDLEDYIKSDDIQ